MSVVYLAEDKRLQKNWVVKEFRHGGKHQQLAKKSLLQEALILQKLEHPQLPRIIDIVDIGETIYIIRDYIIGEPLDKVIENKGVQSQETVIEWFKQLLNILRYMHTRTPTVVYRDLKPANIMLRPDGSIHLFDFGTAIEVGENINIKEFASIGTRGYAAPEQFGNETKIDSRTDIYALGITIHYLLTGKNPTEEPFELFPIRQYNPNLSAGLEAIITKCTQFSPNGRYNSCDEILSDLERLHSSNSPHKSFSTTVAVVSSLAIFMLVVVLVVVLAFSPAVAPVTPINSAALPATEMLTTLPLYNTAPTSILSEPEKMPTSLPNGYNTQIYDDGEYKGNYVNGIKSGHGVYKWTNGDVYEGNFVNGEPSGKGIYTMANGIVYDGYFEEELSGKGKIIWTNGSIYEGNFVDGAPSGNGIYTTANGIVYDGYFEEGRFVYGFENGNPYPLP
ncbi:MAG: protein kinase [Oscillospiraceae bacterium]|nr:protein kinase [Oscillospiraceae bacterium]